MTQSRMSAERAVRKVRTLAKKGQFGEALALCSAEMQRFPDEKRLVAEFDALGVKLPADRLPLEIQVERLKALFQAGEHSAVTAWASRLAQHYPRFPVLPKMLGGSHQALERYDRAAGAYRLAALLTPNDAAVQRNLGAVLAKLMRHGEAVSAYEAAIRLDPLDHKTIGARAISLAALSRRDEAMAAFAAAAALAPDDITLRHDLALAQIALGETEAATQTLADILSRMPHHAEGHFTLSRTRRYQSGDPHMAEMEALLARDGVSAESRVYLHFALGKAHDQAGDVDRAFGHFVAANGLKRELMPYDIDAQAQMFADVRTGFASLVSKMAGFRPRAPLARRPIFVLGMPRSGTTLTEQILASHSTVRGGGEMRALRDAIQPLFRTLAEGSRDEAWQAAEKIRDAYGRALADAGGAEPVVTDKMPANFIYAGFISLIFPEAKVVHLVRDKMATCWSNYRQFFAENSSGYVYDLSDLARYHQLHDEQMAYWNLNLPGAIYGLGYERLTENQEAETRALLQWCDLAFEPGCLDFHLTRRRVETASRDQVQRPMYRGSSDDWRRYAAHLAPLAAALGEEASAAA